MQALNGFASTQVTTPQPQQPTANPYQGAGLSSATTATAQPASAVNLLTLQQLLAANGTTNLALANGAQGKQKSSILMGFSCNLVENYVYFKSKFLSKKIQVFIN